MRGVLPQVDFHAVFITRFDEQRLGFLRIVFIALNRCVMTVTDSRLFKFLDQNGNADVDDGEVTAIATFEGVSNAIVITDKFVIDFSASGGSGF